MASSADKPVASALELLTELKTSAQQLWQNEVYLVPIRHHSPSCAFALKKLLEEVKPKSILIEAPTDFLPLLDGLLDPETQPPVAIFSHRSRGENLQSSYFPLCEYSPEWVAIRHKLLAPKTKIQFIDLPYHLRDGEHHTGREESREEITNLMQERYLHHNQYLNVLARKLGCQNAQEAWEAMFEQRCLTQLDDWRSFFVDVYSYCALARKNYEPAVLAEEGDIAREAEMRRHIYAKHLAKPIVVVTGGFHTPALLEAKLIGLDKSTKGKQTQQKHDQAENTNWLIRYSYDQLDKMSGYSAGMPAPTYFHSLYNAMESGSEDYLNMVANEFLVKVANHNRSQKLTQFIGHAEIKAASFVLQGLAALRHRQGPGRREILDAITTAFIKQDIAQSLQLISDAHRTLAGDALGNIPDNQQQVPLILEARNLAKKHRLTLDNTASKALELNVYKNAKHRETSRFLHLMQWLQVGFSRKTAGPDFVYSTSLGLVKEQWEYGWAPAVEANLSSLMTEGTSLYQVAFKKLTKTSQANIVGSQSSAIVAKLVCQACVMGMQEMVSAISTQLFDAVQQDQSAASLLDCLNSLLTMSHKRHLLNTEKLSINLAEIAQHAWRQVQFLLQDVANISANTVDQRVSDLMHASQVVDQLFYQNRTDEKQERTTFNQLLLSIADNPNVPAKLAGACTALNYLRSQIGHTEFVENMRKALQTNQSPDYLVQYFAGFAAISKELLWTVPAVLKEINQLVVAISEERFIDLLVPLRGIFTALTPTEIDRLAQAIRLLDNEDTSSLIVQLPVLPPEDAALLTKTHGVMLAKFEKLGILTKGAET